MVSQKILLFVVWCSTVVTKEYTKISEDQEPKEHDIWQVIAILIRKPETVQTPGESELFF